MEGVTAVKGTILVEHVEKNNRLTLQAVNKSLFVKEKILPKENVTYVQDNWGLIGHGKRTGKL